MSRQVDHTKIRLGCLGGGWDSAVGRAHLSAYRMDGLFDLQAACFSTDGARNKTSAEKYGLPASGLRNSLSDLLNSSAKSALDAILILTPTDQHFDQVMECLDYGIPVISEKSLAASADEARQIMEKSREKDIPVFVTFNYLGYPMLRELKAMIDTAALGEIQQLHVEMPQEGFLKKSADGHEIVPQSWRLKDASVPTVSLDLGTHVHSIIDYLLETEVNIVSSVSQSYGYHSDIIDTVYGTATSLSKATINIWYTKAALGHRNGLKVRVYGTKGSASWYQENSEILDFTNEYGMQSQFVRGSHSLHVANDERYTRFKAGHPAGFIEAFANIYMDIAFSLRGGDTFAPIEKSAIIAASGLDFLERLHAADIN